MDSPLNTPAPAIDPVAAALPLPDWPLLNAHEARVLGALVEKQLTTPDYYPLTMTALLAACSQKNNRDPVMQVNEAEAIAALDNLRERKLAWQVFLAGNRVPKYRHAFTDVYHVPEAAVAVLAELLLRGPQTAAELRQHVERMQPFPDVAAVEALLQALAEHPEGPFVTRLPREPGRREARYAQLLGGPPAGGAEPAAAATEAIAPGGALPPASRLERLEQAVATLTTRLDELQARFEALSRQLGA